MQPKVYLADLRYNYIGVLANDTFPLGVAYMKTVMDRDLGDAIDSRLFAYPEKLASVLRQDPPDVLMVSNYVWNESLSRFFCRLAKRLNPNTLTVMGGPNLVLEPERQISYFAKLPEVDVYVLGEGDFLAREIVQLYLDSGLSVKKMGEGEIPSSLYRRPDGAVVRNPTWTRHKEIEEIPSPFLSGNLDEFFDGHLTPLIETNRGCPFTCTFCCQGTGWYTKVHNFSLDRIREELYYIARRIRDLSPYVGALRIADSNYGMFERDIEISRYLGETQKLYGYPVFIDATTGKNRPDRIIKSVEQVNGALVLYQAVQSLDETVLRKVKRQTIKLEAYEQLQIHMRGRGLRSNSDLILGLPGETLASHRKGLFRLLDSGISQVTNFQLMLLKGTELETLSSREEFKFQSGWRILPKNFGIYEGECVFDVEEVVVSTDTLSFRDYLEARKYALASTVFWRGNAFEDAISFAESFGVKRARWLESSVDMMEQDRGAIRKMMDEFIEETRNELFPSREACIEFYRREENFERLKRGEVGENLMHKYRALAAFRLWPEICDAAMQFTRQLLLEVSADSLIPDFENLWEDLTRFTFLRQAHGYEVNQILAPAEGEFHYDIAQWLAAGRPADASRFKLSSPQRVRFALSDDSRRELASALETWTNTVAGISKLVTRIRVTCQYRDVLPVPVAETLVATARA